MRIVPATLALTILLPGLAMAQKPSSSEADKSKEKKAKPARVFTDEDLRRARGETASQSTGLDPAPTDASTEAKPADAPPADAAAGATPPGPTQPGAPTAEGDAQAPPAPAVQGPKEKTADELKAEAQDAWRKKLEKARTDATALQQLADKIQVDLNDVSGGVYSNRRATMVQLLEETKTKLAATKQTIETLENEGRRNGYR
jgi:hypothetical protein